MQVDAGTSAGGAHPANGLSPTDTLAGRNRDLGKMGIKSAKAIAVVDNNPIAVSPGRRPANDNDGAGIGGQNTGSAFVGNINPLMIPSETL